MSKRVLKEEIMNRGCTSCYYAGVEYLDPPCSLCEIFELWEPDKKEDLNENA